MKKVLLSAAFALCALAGSAQGLVSVGANIVIAPSSQWDTTMPWEAKVFVITNNEKYSPWSPYYPEELFPDFEGDRGNIQYNQLCYEQEEVEDIFLKDANGNWWYEPAYETEGIEYENFYFYDEQYPDSVPVVRWETHEAPFSSDAVFEGKTGKKESYVWCGNSVISDILMRRTFTVDPNQLLSGNVYLACGHDDAPCEYYLNGVLVFQRTGYEVNAAGTILNGWDNNDAILLTDEQKALIKLGGEENLLAVHVHQNWGGAFADCGIYTMTEGGLPMGYNKPWMGKTLFNSVGGYNFDGVVGGAPNPIHGWELLYEAKADDVYSFNLGNILPEEYEWGKQVHFKSPIRIEEDKDYTFTMNIHATSAIQAPIIKLTDNDDDEIEAAIWDEPLGEGDNNISLDITGTQIKNFKIAMNFGAAEADSTVISISGISLKDSEDNELWVGTHYFNYMFNTEIYPVPVYDEETGDSIGEEYKWYHVKDFTIEGRGEESLAWTLEDFDDSMWDDTEMPIGNDGYMPEVKTIWPGGDNTNYWIRRTFELDKVNERLSYALNVCHDDDYWTYVNGHLLQQNYGWSKGKNPFQVHIPAKYLHPGKNVIATYIRQNWGEKFYDCGINVEEVNYDACVLELKNAIAYAEEDVVLTAAMKAEIAELIEAAKVELEVNKDAAEVKEYARQLKENVNKIRAYSGDVKNVLTLMQLMADSKDNGYLQPALGNAQANVDTCHTAAQVNVFAKELRIARKRNAAERRTEDFVGLSFEELEIGTEAYFYNVGAKQFLGGGEAWGTHLCLVYTSNAFMLDEDREGEGFETENTYRVRTFRPNGVSGINDYMGWNGFVDCNVNDGWQFIPVEGKKNVFNIVQAGKTNNETGGLNYLGLRDGDNGQTVGNPNQFNVVDTDMRTAELETNQWMLISAEELNSFAAGATAEQPADLTHLIINPNFDQRVTLDAWSHNGTQGGYGVWGRNGNYVDFVFEAWNTNDDFEEFQEIYDWDETLLVPGWYSLSAQAYYRDGTTTAHMQKLSEGAPLYNNGYIFATWVEASDETDEATIAENTAIANVWMYHELAGMAPGSPCGGGGDAYQVPDACWAAAENFFQYGLAWNTVKFQIPEGCSGYLKIGAKKILADGAEKSSQGDWLVTDNYRLKFYGATEPEVSAIDAIESDQNKTNSLDVYNLAGQRLSRVQKGVNIVNGKKYVVK